MKKVNDDCFAVDEQMPCSPRDIRVWHWALPSTLDHTETEEAAARILHFSQKLDQWVGVSLTRLGQMMEEEYEKEKRLRVVRHRNQEEKCRYDGAMCKYRLLSLVTLGLYNLFVQKPTKHMEELPNVNLPFSGIFAFGPHHVVNGIQDLVKRGFLRQHTEGEGDDAYDVFFPTPHLVSRIMEVQGIAAS